MQLILRVAIPVLFLSAWSLKASDSVVLERAEHVATPRSAIAQPLLFSFVTSRAGLDTEITIANTSLDTVGSTPHGGTCSLNFYGSGTAPTPQTTLPIAAGQHFVFRLSQGDTNIAAVPDFTGYLIASCSFPLARGTARVSSNGKLAFGLDAELLRLPRTNAGPGHLLFPFVSNQSGNDTTLVIANSSQDPFGTAAAPGACRLHFYGDHAPGTFTTPQIAAGSVYRGLVSDIAPGFQGYAVASCDFPGAAGAGIPSDPGFQKGAFADAAEIVTLPRSPAQQTLLFPSLSSKSGHDTEIAIANTTADPFHSAHAAGSCTLNFYGDNAPSPVATPQIAAGEVYTTALSAIAPDFQGYLQASCSFPLARHWPSGETVPAAASPGRLLFPAVSNRQGLDTRITIANPSPAPFACSIGYRGSMAGDEAVPADQRSSTIAPGDELSFSLSSGNSAQGVEGAPGFRGYVLAQCGPMAAGIATVAPATTATPLVSSVADSAATTPALCPGILATIYGANLGSSSSPPTVTVAGQQAYVVYTSSGQLNVEFPVNAPLGPTSLTVTVGGVGIGSVSDFSPLTFPLPLPY